MTLLETVAAYLAAQTGLVQGTTLFRGGLPATGTDAVTAISQSGGFPRGEQPHVDATFQVMTRGLSLGACLTQAEAVYAACVDTRRLPKLGVVTGGRTIALLEPMQPPADIGLDAEGRRRTSWNIRVIATEP